MIYDDILMRVSKSKKTLAVCYIAKCLSIMLACFLNIRQLMKGHVGKSFPWK